MKKFQQILTLALSLGFLAVFSAWFLIAPDAEESTVERRRLAKRPALSFSSVTNGSFMNGFEKYMLDQFPLRNGFRSLKAAVNAKVFMKKDNNGLYSVGEHLSKLDFPTDSESVDHAARRFRYVYDTYLRNAGTKTYLSVIPDKNTFIASQNGYPDKDYKALTERLRSGFPAPARAAGLPDRNKRRKTVCRCPVFHTFRYAPLPSAPQFHRQPS